MADLFKKKEVTETPNTEEKGNVKKEKTKKEKPAKKQYLEHNNMNFLERYETVVEGKKAEVDISAYKLPILIVAIVLVVALVFAQGMCLITKGQVKSLEKYINDENNIAAYNEAVAVKTKIDDATAQKANLESMINAIATYPDVDKNFFTQIATAASSNNVVVGTYGYAGNTGFLSLSCIATNPQDISNFVRALGDTKLFTDVQYSGFSGGAEGGFSFTVSCYCVAGK